MELATWLNKQGEDHWWNVDGDPLLTGRLSFPCPSDELASELEVLARPLLVQAKKGDTRATGQEINADQLDEIVQVLADNIQSTKPLPPWARDRILYLSWKDSPHEWILEEDSTTANEMQSKAADQKA